MTTQYHLPLPQRCSMEAEDFLPSSANKGAVDWLMRRGPETWPSHAAILWGPDGSGKTHLLSIWAKRENAVFVQPEDEALNQIMDGNAPSAFVLDNADRVCESSVAQEWLQHFYNATRTASLPFLMASRKPPALWGLSLRDIETRLKSCHSIEIFQPDDDLMRGLLLKLFADRQLMVEAGVVEFLATRLSRTGAAILGAVEALDEAALETGRKISIPFAQRALTLMIGEDCL